MIVQQIGDSDQIVLQTDHDDLSGEFARAWGGDSFWSPMPRDDIVLACANHDAGWEDWERSPQVDDETGYPLNFLDVDIPTHLELYRNGIRRVSAEAAYAGVIVSMHGSGIYRERYGTQPALGLRKRSPANAKMIDQFVQEQEEHQSRTCTALGVSRDELWNAYRLLQVADRFSLFMAFSPQQHSTMNMSAAPGASGEDVSLQIERITQWNVRLTPYPLETLGVEFTLVRRVLPHRSWRNSAEFAKAFAEAEPERRTIRVTS